MSIAETQFSIYKINCELVENTFEIKAAKETDEYYEEIINALINSMAYIIRNKSGSEQQVFKI